MKKRWVIIAMVAIVLSLLAWDFVKTANAGSDGIVIRKDDRTLNRKLSKKLDQVLANQRIIIEKLAAIKGSIKTGKK